MDKQVMTAVRDYRVLYDKGARGFKDKRKKENAWKEIGTKLELDPKECETIYKSQRTKFGRYMKSVKPPSGSGRDSIDIRPEWEHLRWLITHITHRTSETNVDTAPGPEAAASPMTEPVIENKENTQVLLDTDEEGQQTEPGSESTRFCIRTAKISNPENTTEKLKWRKGKKALCNASNQMSQFEEELPRSITAEATPTDKNDQTAHFGQTVISKLRWFTPYQQALAQSRTLQVLTDIEFSSPAPPSQNSTPAPTPNSSRQYTEPYDRPSSGASTSSHQYSDQYSAYQTYAQL